MSILITAIRDQVVETLNAASLDPALTAVAIYDLAFDLKELSGGRLSVMPQTKEPTLISRGGAQKSNVKIDVAVQFKYEAPTAEELDPYQDLAERIPDLFVGEKFAIDGTDTVCMEAAFPHGCFMQEHIIEFGVFTSVITLTFKFT